MASKKTTAKSAIAEAATANSSTAKSATAKTATAKKAVAKKTAQSAASEQPTAQRPPARRSAAAQAPQAQPAADGAAQFSIGTFNYTLQQLIDAGVRLDLTVQAGKSAPLDIGQLGVSLASFAPLISAGATVGLHFNLPSIAASGTQLALLQAALGNLQSWVRLVGICITEEEDE